MRSNALRTLELLAVSALLAGGCTVSEGGSTAKSDTVVSAATTPAGGAAGAAGTAPAPAPAPASSATMGSDSATASTGATGTASGGDVAGSTGAMAAAQPNSAAGAAPGAAPTPAAKAVSPLRLEVDIKKRQVHLYEGDKLLETHRVAVGSSQWPTQPGEWKVVQVVFNPEWIPPDESWAEEREPKKPGAPDNPLGRAQLVYDPPRTIHGTNQPQSIGKAVSHGSIRMANAEIIALAKRIMAASGAPKDSAWFRQADTERTRKQIVDLPMPVPIRVF